MKETETPTAGDQKVSFDEEDVREALKDVVDPELGINIVDLGLLYGVRIEGESVILEMTLTSAACPLTDVIEDQVHNALMLYTKDARIEWVWTPPWSLEKLTDDGRDQIRALGFTIV